MSSSKSSSHHRKISQDELSDSWVACEMTSDGENSEKLAKEMERLLRDAQRESGQSSLMSSSKSSKVGSSPNTPFNSPQSTPGVSGHVTPSEKTTEQQTLPADEKKATDDAELVWSWASTPEIRPRKNVSYKRPQRKSLNLSLRKTSAMKSGIFSWDFLQVFIPSMILSNLVAFGFGIYIGKRIAQSRVTAL